MDRATPACSLPTIPRSKSEPVPQWCVRRFPCVGAHSVMLRGFDGEGYPLYEWVFPLDEDLERWERLMQTCIDARRMKSQGALTTQHSADVRQFLAPGVPPALRLDR